MRYDILYYVMKSTMLKSSNKKSCTKCWGVIFCEKVEESTTKPYIEVYLWLASSCFIWLNSHSTPHVCFRLSTIFHISVDFLYFTKYIKTILTMFDRLLVWTKIVLNSGRLIPATTYETSYWFSPKDGKPFKMWNLWLENKSSRILT